MKTLAQHIAEVSPSRAFRPALMLVPWLACLAVALLIHYAAPMAVNDYWVNVMRRMGVFIVAAVSLNIVNGYTGQFSMGHAGFMAIGAYIGAAVTYYGSLLAHGSTNDPAFYTQGVLLMLAGILAAGCVAAGAGLIVGLPSLRLHGDYLAIVTLGFGEIIRVLLELTSTQIYDAKEVTLGALATFPLNGPVGFERIPGYASLFWIYLFAAITCLIAFRVKMCSSGRAFLSIREDEIAARSMGINLTKYKVRAFVLAAFFGGVAGALYAHTGVNPSPTDAGFARSFDIIIMVVLGGLGSISGSVLAAIILIALPEALRDLQQYRLIVYALLLIGMMLLRPQGLFGVKEVWDLFRRKPQPKDKDPHGPARFASAAGTTGGAR
ncbi:MAG TPA: branched-chain amino acid ABC transporter permease [Phycisphaerales bacterium]|nr:branched-chain amino acid ABC transporter permease [Phycisphaerales bacterium]